MCVHPPTPLVDHRDESAPGVVVVRVLLHVLGEVHDLLREDGHHDAGRPRVLLVLAPLQLGGLPGQLVQVRLEGGARAGGVTVCVRWTKGRGVTIKLLKIIPCIYRMYARQKQRRARQHSRQSLVAIANAK